MRVELFEDKVELCGDLVTITLNSKDAIELAQKIIGFYFMEDEDDD